MGTVTMTLRALCALALLAGFYVLATGVAGILVLLPFAMYRYGHRIDARLAIVCLGGAFTILRASIFVPRPAFHAPGPEIHADEQPELFALIRDVAARMKTRMPAHVYMIPDVNAFVAEVGGFLGVGSTRVMGIGLGLLHVDDVSNLKATLAHEFGHYAGGHTRLGGVVYAARAAIANVVESLGDRALSKPFELYGRFYLRITRALGRAQELEADRAGIEIAGREAHVDGLRVEGRGGLLFPAFIRSEIAPLIEANMCPSSLYAGFRRFVDGAPAVDVDQALESRTAGPYDTHPVFSDRIAFAATVPDPATARDRRPAIAIVRRPEEMETRLEPYLFQALGVEGALARVSWEELPAKFYTPRWAERARIFAERLFPALHAAPPYARVAGALLAALPSRRRELASVIEPEVAELPSDARDEAEATVLGVTLAALLGAAYIEAGAVWSTSVGTPLVVRLGATEVDPFRLGHGAVEGGDGIEAYRSALRAVAPEGVADAGIASASPAGV
jgi:Zn-dependent protease with chaperone function